MTIKNRIERAEKSYWSAIEAIAKHSFSHIIVPFLTERGYRFLSGNGTYLVVNCEDIIDPDSLPLYIREVLDLEVYRGQCLGSFMPHF